MSSSVRPRRKLFLCVLGALLVVCAVLAVWLLPLKEHETNSDAISVVVSQAELDEVAGIHPRFDGGEVSEVVGSAHGALLVMADGVVSLAGEQWPLARNGQWDEQWRYLADRPLTSVDVLPEGERVALTYGRPGKPGHSVVMLEARTGELAGGARLGGRFEPEDEFHFSGSRILHRSGSELSSYALSWDGKFDSLDNAASWTMTDDDLCPEADTAEEAQIAGTAPGFVVSVRCAAEGEGSHVITHLDDSDGGELWRFDWDQVEPGSPAPDLLVVSAALIVDSPQDIVPDVLAPDSTTSYAVAMEQEMGGEPEYSEPLPFSDVDVDGYLSPPLQDTEDLPGALLVGDAQDLEDHLVFQGAKTIVDDPDTGVTREDISLLRWPADGEWKEPNSYRAYPDGSSFKWDVMRDLRALLS